jgi:HAD superfamily hydrolase (TIGR01484 family)
MQYKALLLDVDGTLIPYNPHLLPSQIVTNAVNKAAEKLHVGVATGRPLFMLTHIIQHLNLNGPSVINDGAQVIDVTTEESYYDQAILPDDLKKVITILNDYTIPFFFQDNTADHPLEGIVPDRVYNIFTDRCPRPVADEIIEKISNIPTIHVHKTTAGNMEIVGLLISHVAATKAHGVSEVAKVLGITPQEIIGVGDSYNDFPLLMACGLKVAMGNAIPDLKAIADYVAPPVTEDGVAHVIEKFILNEH